MPMPADEIRKLIQDAIPDAVIEMTDLAGDNNHFAAHIVSAEFQGKSSIQRHQLVYRALGDKMGTQLHALSLTTRTPDEH